MFDPEDKKARMDKAKEQARQRTQLPPIGNPNSSLVGATLSDYAYWEHMIINFEAVQKAYGVSVEKGIWILVNPLKTEKFHEPYKSWFREFLEKKKKEGKFHMREDW